MPIEPEAIGVGERRQAARQESQAESLRGSTPRWVPRARKRVPKARGGNDHGNATKPPCRLARTAV